MTADTLLDDAFTELIALQLTIVMACALTGRSRATHDRRVSPPARKAAPVPQAERAKPPSALSEDERAVVLTVINSPAYAGPVDLSDLGAGAGRGPVPLLDVHDVSDRAGCRADPGAAPARRRIRRR